MTKPKPKSTIQQFRKKSPIVEAVQFEGNPEEILAWVPDSKLVEGEPGEYDYIEYELPDLPFPSIRANVEDWIIKFSYGFAVMTNAEFQANYELATSQ